MNSLQIHDMTENVLLDVLIAVFGLFKELSKTEGRPLSSVKQFMRYCGIIDPYWQLHLLDLNVQIEDTLNIQ